MPDALHEIAQSGDTSTQPAAEGGASSDGEAAHGGFITGGAIPPVAPSCDPQHVEASASELAYGAPANPNEQRHPGGRQQAGDALGSAPGGDMWRDLFQADSVTVGQSGRISAPNGRHLFAKPDPAAPAASGVLPFGTLVHVERRTTQKDVAQRWVYVVGSGAAGFCEERYVAIAPPEPNATLRLVEKGDTLFRIAAEAYGTSFSQGNDARQYVEALYVANKGRPGIKLTEVDLGSLDSALRGSAEQETLKVFEGARVVAGQNLWIPSEAFVQQLKLSGTITSGQTVGSPAWAEAKKRMRVDPELASEAGTTVGLLDGAYEAIRDLYKGSADLLRLGYELEKDALTQLRPVMEIAAKKLIAFLEKFPNLDALTAAVGSYVAKRWEDSDQFGRAEFVGEVVGYIGMNVLLVIASAGESIGAEIAEGGSDLSRVALAILKAVDDGANPITYIKPLAKGIKVPIELLTRSQPEEAVVRANKSAAEIEHGAEVANRVDNGRVASPESRSPRKPTANPRIESAAKHAGIELGTLTEAQQTIIDAGEREIASGDIVKAARTFDELVASGVPKAKVERFETSLAESLGKTPPSVYRDPKAKLPNGTSVPPTVYGGDLYYGTSEITPEVAFEKGLPGRGGNTKLLDHVHQHEDTAFRGTTRFPISPDGDAGAGAWAGDGGWVYKIDGTPSWDVNAELQGRVSRPDGTYGGNPVSGEQEQAVLANIPRERIVGAMQMHERNGRLVPGPLKPNPHYRPRT